MQAILSRLMGNPFYEIWETQEKIDEKLRTKFKVNLNKNLTRIIFNYIIFSIKIPTYRKNTFSKNMFMFREIDNKHNA